MFGLLILLVLGSLLVMDLRMLVRVSRLMNLLNLLIMKVMWVEVLCICFRVLRIE